MIQTTVMLPFTPREWQIPLIEDRSRKIVAVVHRRGGKSTAFVWRALKTAATEERGHIPPAQRNLRNDRPRVVHVLPAQVMWQRTGLWDKVTRAAESFPGARIMKSVLRIELPNGGIYQCGGMDRPDAWRGGYSDLVIEDEADDVIASGLDMVVVPMLADYSGQRIKIGTPKGNGRLADAYNDAATDPDASRYLLRYTDTNVFTPQQVADIQKDLDEEEFEQEMNCSFTSPNSGSYYGKWLDAAVRDERIRKVTHDPRLPVYTSWDLGVADSTSIWFFQISPGGEWRWLKYYEDSGQGLDTYAKLLQQQDYVYKRHLLPHDIEVRELTYQGRSRRHYLEGLGVRPIKVVPAANPAERISAARAILPRSYFDAEGCAIGLKKLRAYKREWNEHMGVWRSDPTHDDASHCADSFGTGVQGALDPENERPKVAPYVPKPRPQTPGAWMGR